MCPEMQGRGVVWLYGSSSDEPRPCVSDLRGVVFAYSFYFVATMSLVRVKIERRAVPPVAKFQKGPFLQGRNGHRDPCQKIPV